MLRTALNTRALTIVAVALALTLSGGPASAKKKRVFSVEDLYKVGRVSQLAVSPNDDLAAFAVKTFDMETNKNVTHLWRADLGSGKSRSHASKPLSVG